jgi:large subunit ribosomal protein L17
MLRNQASALLQHERIETTVARGKELRPFVERIITVAKRSLNTPEGGTQGVTARRIVSQDIANREVVTKLFDTIAPRFNERQGGYTRLLRLGHRRGDATELAEVQLVGSEYDPNAVSVDKTTKGETPDEPKKRTMGERLRGALGGRKKDEIPGGGKVEKKAKGAAKSTTPRKAGGS